MCEVLLMYDVNIDLVYIIVWKKDKMWRKYNCVCNNIIIGIVMWHYINDNISKCYYIIWCNYYESIIECIKL